MTLRERVRDAIRDARGMPLCELCQGRHAHIIRCNCYELADAAIAVMQPDAAIAELRAALPGEE